MTNPIIIEASKAKNIFGSLAQRANDVPIEITRHGKLQAVMISPDMYRRVQMMDQANLPELEKLEQAFQSMIAGMQSKRSNAAYDRLESLSAEQVASHSRKVHIQSKMVSRAKSLKKEPARPRLRLVK